MSSLNIKNPEAFRLAHQLAKVTGQSVTGAVTESLRESLRRGKHDAKQGAFVERWMKWTSENAWRVKEPYRSTDHGDLLYDDQGLPK